MTRNGPTAAIFKFSFISEQSIVFWVAMQEKISFLVRINIHVTVELSELP